MKSKNIILTIVFALLLLTSKSQITLDNTYSTTINNNFYFSMVKLSNSGYKYVNPNLTANTITLYNLNNTVFKTLIVPTSTSNVSCYYISETLFNTNASDVEFIIRQYNTSTGGIPKILVVNEFGTILFSRDSMDFAGYQWLTQTPISFSSSGVKMMLYHKFNDKVDVYNLPGSLVCSDCTNGTITSLTTLSNGNGTNFNASPNPSNSEIKIKYALPADNSKAKIYFYTLDGKELKTFDIDNHIDFMTIDKETLGASSGMYLYKIYNSTKLISTNKIVFE